MATFGLTLTLDQLGPLNTNYVSVEALYERLRNSLQQRRERMNHDVER